MSGDPDWARKVKPRRGYVYRADDGAVIEVRRVARDGSWADILVTHGQQWTKRQPLRDGLLPFPAVIWETP